MYVIIKKLAGAIKKTLQERKNLTRIMKKVSSFVSDYFRAFKYKCSLPRFEYSIVQNSGGIHLAKHFKCFEQFYSLSSVRRRRKATVKYEKILSILMNIVCLN